MTVYLFPPHVTGSCNIFRFNTMAHLHILISSFSVKFWWSIIHTVSAQSFVTEQLPHLSIQIDRLPSGVLLLYPDIRIQWPAMPWVSQDVQCSKFTQHISSSTRCPVQIILQCSSFVTFKFEIKTADESSNGQ